jgi:O-antigen ligase
MGAGGPRGVRAASWVTGAAFVMLHLQSVTLTGQAVMDGDGPSVKPFHVGLALLALWPLAQRRLVRWRPEFATYLFALVVSAGIAYAAEGAPNSRLVNIGIAAYSAALGAALGFSAGETGVRSALRGGAAVVLAAVLVKAVVCRDVLLAFLAAPSAHPNMPTFVSGGVTLEATWLAIVAAAWVGSWGLLLAVAGAVVVAMLYATRASLLVSGAVLALGAACALGGGGWRARPRLTAALVALGAGAVLGGGAAASTLSELPGVEHMVARFTALGEEPGSVGRLTLWGGALDAFTRHPWGVGPGNAVRAVEREIGADLIEQNLHNQYLQHFVEHGPIGGLAFLAFAAGAFYRARARGWRDPGLNITVAYLAASFLTLRGADPIAFFAYGLSMGADHAHPAGAAVPDEVVSTPADSKTALAPELVT